MLITEGTIIGLFLQDATKTLKDSVPESVEALPGTFEELLEATATGIAGHWSIPCNVPEIDADGRVTWSKVLTPSIYLENEAEGRRWTLIEHVTTSRAWCDTPISVIVTKLEMNGKPFVEVAIETIENDGEKVYKAYRTMRYKNEWINLEEALWGDSEYPSDYAREAMIGGLENEIEDIRAKIQLVKDFKLNEM